MDLMDSSTHYKKYHSTVKYKFILIFRFRKVKEYSHSFVKNVNARKEILDNGYRNCCTVFKKYRRFFY